ncbi:retinoic acid receptor responder protein 1-like [Ascaphus truei]|uniref:retinoic acid receptor responder protein 1-like n=1 Tax=Ascaphus truei TaxID=8439 RepID=UPI003F5A70C3
MQRLFCLLVTLLPLSIEALPFSVSSGSWATLDIPTYQRAARETARVAVHYLNYYSGSPHQLLVLGEVKKASVKSVPEIGHKYYIEFTTNSFQTNQNVGLCTATVFFQAGKPGPAINVNCTANDNLKKQQAHDDDYNFYQKMKKQTTPITAKDIPDSFGAIQSGFEPLWYLALAGSSYVMWEKTTENRNYNMAQIKTVTQVLRKDDFIAFDYNILLHEIPTQRMVPCSIHVIWIPGKPPKVEYECSTESEETGSGSESEEGSAFLGNFK